MKSKLYLIALCTSVMCTSSVYGAVPCPAPGSADLGPWQMDTRKRSPEEFRALFLTSAFKNAWLYDPGSEAKCNYVLPDGITISLLNPDLNTKNFHFDENVVKERSPSHPNGFHCKATREACVFMEGGRDKIKGA